LIHGDKYDYKEVEYINAGTKVKIYCIKCSEFFEQIPNNHLKGFGCRRCGNIVKANKRRKPLELFIEHAQLIHGDKYGYEKVEYINAHVPVKIYCFACSTIFEQKPNNHLQGQGCPRCSLSKGYSDTSLLWLKSLDEIRYPNIQHAGNIGEYKIPNTKYRADGYCAEYNIIFEYHGEYWHGCPECYDKNEINSMTKTTMSELFENTKAKKKIIEELGYEYICQWGCGHNPDI
jgi:hypothetical protein